MTSEANLVPTRDKSITKLSQENGLAAVLASEHLCDEPSVAEKESATTDLETNSSPHLKQTSVEQPRVTVPAAKMSTDFSLAPPLPPKAPARTEAPVKAASTEATESAKSEVPSSFASAKPKESVELMDPVLREIPVESVPIPTAMVPIAAACTSYPFPSSPGLPPRDAAKTDNGAFEAATVAAHYESLLDDYTVAPSIKAGDICRGRVVSVSAMGVVVDINSKCEGIIPIDDFFAEGDKPRLPHGEEIDVLIERPSILGEYAVLSYKRARQIRVWGEIEEAFREQKTVEGRILEHVKGGLTVDVGVPAFLHGSQVDVRPVSDLNSLVGTTLPVRIIKLNKRRGNALVSRRVLLEEELQEIKQQTLAKLKLGNVVQGTVKNITDYGVFVDLGGLDGRIHVTDISWGRVQDPRKVFTPGDQISAKVIRFDPEKERVSLSTREMTPDPWAGIAERYQAGQKITGKVTSLNDYGAFIEVEPGVEGLAHVSEMSWSQRIRHPSKIMRLEDQVEAVILTIEPAARRISLSFKQNKPDPWLDLSERCPIGTVVKGCVRNMTSYGAFVEIEEGVEGLIHISDLSWDQQPKHPNEVLKKGHITQAVVIHVDTDSRKLSLGVKQLQPDQWETFFSCHLIGDEVTGKVTQLTNFGALVKFASGVEGICRSSEIYGGKPAQLKVGQTHKFKIVKLDEFGKKIDLSRYGVVDVDQRVSVPEARSAGRGTKQPVITPETSQEISF